MPKRVFYPLALVTMGLVLLASNLGLLPKAFFNLWPLIVIIVGLGGWVTSDRDEWMSSTTTKKKKKKSTKKAGKKKTGKKKKK